MSINVIVASKNPVKINAVKSSFEKMFQDQEILCEGIDVDSMVSDQPMSDQETQDGAKNRSENARKEKPEADFWVGLEGGIHVEGDEMQAFAWMWIINKDNQVGKSKTGVFYLPPEVVNLVHQGIELGHANDQVFKQHNSKQKGGAVGSLTHGLLGRTAYYEQALVLALIPLVNPEMYAI